MPYRRNVLSGAKVQVGGPVTGLSERLGCSCCPGGLGSGCDHEFAWWPGLEVLPGLADVIQPCLLQVQGELPVDRVMHQLRVGGTAHLGGRDGLAVTHERKQLVAEGGRVDRGRGPRGAPDLDVPGAYVGVVY